MCDLEWFQRIESDDPRADHARKVLGVECIKGVDFRVLDVSRYNP